MKLSLLLFPFPSPSRRAGDSTRGAKPPLAPALSHVPFVFQHRSSSLSCFSNTPAALGYWKQSIANALLSCLHPCLLLPLFLRLCFPFNKEFAPMLFLCPWSILGFIHFILYIFSFFFISFIFIYILPSFPREDGGPCIKWCRVCVSVWQGLSSSVLIKPLSRIQWV